MRGILMKKSFVLVGIAIAGMLFSACSSSSSGEASLAEKCANGVTEECLEGATWNMNAFYNSTDGETFTAYQKLSTPSTLVFNKDKTFSLTYSTDVAVNSENMCLGDEESGNWSLAGNALTMNFTFGCILGASSETVSTTLSLLTVDSLPALNFGVNKIHQTGLPGYEIFTGVEK